ncbi:hypothetical protein FRIGORI9N_240031 [Frigoribacterium sp. 9N]|nr:hypothetical protein FRIGORI9N_240031 [Frigoribacterium sp. 9N]
MDRPGPKQNRGKMPRVSLLGRPEKVEVGLPDVGDADSQHGRDGRFRHAEGPPEADRRQLARVDHAVDRHLRHAHHVGHLGDREEPHIRQILRHDPASSRAPGGAVEQTGVPHVPGGNSRGACDSV